MKPPALVNKTGARGISIIISMDFCLFENGFLEISGVLQSHSLSSMLLILFNDTIHRLFFFRGPLDWYIQDI